MTNRLACALTLASLALAACSDEPPPISVGDPAADLSAEETIAPGAEGLYRGDPLAGPDIDPTSDPL